MKSVDNILHFRRSVRIPHDPTIARLLDDIRHSRAARVGVILRCLYSNTSPRGRYGSCSHERTESDLRTASYTATPYYIQPLEQNQCLYEPGPRETFPATHNDLFDYLEGINFDFRIDRHLAPWILLDHKTAAAIRQREHPHIYESTNNKETLAGLPCYIIQEKNQ